MNKNKLAPLSALTLTLLSSQAIAATYNVVELPSKDKGLQSFPQAINNSGEVITTVQLPFLPVIDVEQLDLDNNSTLEDALTDAAGVRNGDINDEDFVTIFNFIRNQDADLTTQQIGEYQSYIETPNSIEQVVGHDQFDANLNGLSESVDTFSYGMNDEGSIVGKGEYPTRKLDYVNEEGNTVHYVIRDNADQGYVQINGVTMSLPPIEDLWRGGESEGRDINNNNLVVGSSTVSAHSSISDAIANCDDEEAREDVPLEVCLMNVTNALVQTRATFWQLNEQGDIEDTKHFGLLLTPTEEDSIFVSRALAVNSNGIAVGVSNDFYQGDSSRVGTFAAIFNGDEVTGITDHDEYFASTATDINDSNLVIGHASKSINGFTRSKFFVHDIESGETVYPTDFFNGSTSVARAINNAGVVVGEGEVDTALNSPRRSHGFVYDHNDQSFTDLNSLIGCDSPYIISQANGINDNGEITATAVVNRVSREINGEAILDDDGNETTEDMVIAVKLVPTGSQDNSCDETEDKVERKGGSFGWLSFILFGLLGLRRKGH